MPNLKEPPIAQSVGHSIAKLAANLLEDDIANRSIVMLIGANDWLATTLATARYLWQADAWVQIIFSSRRVVDENAEILQMAGLDELAIPFAWAEDGWELPPSDLIIDAILCGHTPVDEVGKNHNLIMLANSSAASILSVGAPSGIDIEQNCLFSPHIHAFATVMAGLPYHYLLQPAIRSLCGKLYLVDAGMDKMAYAESAMALPVFDEDGLCCLGG